MQEAGLEITLTEQSMHSLNWILIRRRMVQGSYQALQDITTHNGKY